LLSSTGTDTDGLRKHLGEWLDRHPQASGTAGEIQLSDELIRVLNLTDKAKQRCKSICYRTRNVG
jgi:ATP-dependent Clp protease ATP-binding subunit ClpB